MNNMNLWTVIAFGIAGVLYGIKRFGDWWMDWRASRSRRAASNGHGGGSE